MAFYQSRIVGPVTLGTTTNSTTAPTNHSYIVEAGHTIIVKQLILSNLTSGSKTVTIWIVPSGSTAGNSSIIFHDLLVNANETTLVNLSLVMVELNSVGDRIFARASAASSINMTISAVDEDGT
jgi:hypothetical protein